MLVKGATEKNAAFKQWCTHSSYLHQAVHIRHVLQRTTFDLLGHEMGQVDQVTKQQVVLCLQKTHTLKIKFETWKSIKCTLDTYNVKFQGHFSSK